MGAARRFLPSALCLPVLAFSAVAARAEVLDIAPNGAVTIYDGPAQIIGQMVTPIAIQPTPSAASPASAMKYRRAAANARLAPALVEAVAWVESRGDAAARSPKGAIGAMQLMPATAAALHVDPYDVEQNISGGAAYLKAMLVRFDGDLERALAAYNAGPAAVQDYRGVPPYVETKAYVAAVMARLSDAAANTGASQ